MIVTIRHSPHQYIAWPDLRPDLANRRNAWWSKNKFSMLQNLKTWQKWIHLVGYPNYCVLFKMTQKMLSANQYTDGGSGV